MSLLNTRNGYGLIPKILHWVIMVLLVMMLASNFQRLDPDFQFSHEIMGKLILALALVRLIIRLAAPALRQTLPMHDGKLACPMPSIGHFTWCFSFIQSVGGCWYPHLMIGLNRASAPHS